MDEAGSKSIPPDGSISTAPCRYKSLKMKLDTDDVLSVNVDGTNFTFIPSDVQLPDGSYTVVYEAVDSDNLTADSYTFWIDGTPHPDPG